LDSSYERGRNAEEMAKKWLQNRFNISFSRRNLRVGSKSCGKPAMHNFDLVSKDNQMIAEVKSHRLTNSGSISGKISDTYQACFMLEKVNAKKKLLILTDPKFYEIFKRYSEGKISKEITVMLLRHNEDRKAVDLKTMATRNRLIETKKTDFDSF